MTLTNLLKEFNIVIDTTEGLTELRSLILGLAVRGKLVPQDSNDEPASELLKKIKLERKRLYDEGEIRKPKRVKKISKDNYPYQIPDNWVWTNLNEAGVINPRNEAEDDLDASFISMSLISEGFMEMYDSEERKWEEIKSGYTHFAENDVGLAKITPCFQNGKAAIFRGLKNQIGAGTTELYIFRSIVEGLMPEYVYAFLKTPDFVNQGVKEMTGTAGQQRVPKGYFEHRPFPLPPADEQQRIVQRIESLLAEVDDLETKLNRQGKLDEKLQLAVNAEVQKAPDAEASKSAWNFITNNFETLYHTPEAIGNLKKNILNEAVRGRLVPQNPKDEPATELLKKIEIEKQRLYDEGEIRKPKKLPPVDKDEIPFKVPESWEWARLGNSSFNLDAKRDPLSRAEREKRQGEYPYYGASGIIDHIDDYIFEGDLLLIGEDGANLINRSTPIAFIASGKYWVNNHAHVLDAIDFKLLKWLEAYVNSINLEPYVTGTAQPKLNQTRLNKILVAIPPLEEQHRIVQRIEELFATCDRFKAQLEQREKVNDRLVKGLVQEVLEETGN